MFVVADFDDHSAADAHRFGQLTLGNSQRLHKLFNEQLTNAYGLTFGNYLFISKKHCILTI